MVKAIHLPAVVGLSAVTLAAGIAVSQAPMLAVVFPIGVVLVGLACSRFSTAVAVLTVSFFFDGYLSPGGSQAVTLAKGLGLLAALAWGLEWIRGRRPAVWDAGLGIAVCFLLWTLASSAGAEHLDAAVASLSRYVSFVGLYFLILQAVNADYRRVAVLVHVAVGAASASAAIGLFAFASGASPRANGPLPDANDFGVLLATVLPLALLARQRAGTPLTRTLTTLAVILLCVTIAATLSRSAGAGLVVAALWAWSTGRVRLGLRMAVTIVSVAGLVGFLAFRLGGDLLETALEQKRRVAEANVDSRFLTWELALREFSTSPLLGVGAGNFQGRSLEFGAPAVNREDVSGTHNAYLDVLAEFGLPGLGLFLGFLGYSWTRLRRRLPDPEIDRLQSAVAAGFIVALVAGIFLNEQYYMQLWFLPALGATLRPEHAPPRALNGEEAPAAGVPDVAPSRAAALDPVR